MNVGAQCFPMTHTRNLIVLHVITSYFALSWEMRKLHVESVPILVVKFMLHKATVLTVNTLFHVIVGYACKTC